MKSMFCFTEKCSKDLLHNQIGSQTMSAAQIVLRAIKVNVFIPQAEGVQFATRAGVPGNLLDLRTQAAVARVLLDDDDAIKLAQHTRDALGVQWFECVRGK